MAFKPPKSVELAAPLMGYRFGVYFLKKSGMGIAYPIDIYFRSVSGIGVRNDPTEKQGPQFENLVLERGLPAASTLSTDVFANLKQKIPYSSRILISLLNEQAMPVKSWLFRGVQPVSWSVSPFDANENEVVIERMEFQYKDVVFFKL
jgi:phage tail-like protein